MLLLFAKKKKVLVLCSISEVRILISYAAFFCTLFETNKKEPFVEDLNTTGSLSLSIKSAVYSDALDHSLNETKRIVSKSHRYSLYIVNHVMSDLYYSKRILVCIISTHT